MRGPHYVNCFLFFFPPCLLGPDFAIFPPRGPYLFLLHYYFLSFSSKTCEGKSRIFFFFLTFLYQGAWNEGEWRYRSTQVIDFLVQTVKFSVFAFCQTLDALFLVQFGGQNSPFMPFWQNLCSPNPWPAEACHKK